MLDARGGCGRAVTYGKVGVDETGIETAARVGALVAKGADDGVAAAFLTKPRSQSTSSCTDHIQLELPGAMKAVSLEMEPAGRRHGKCLAASAP